MHDSYVCPFCNSTFPLIYETYNEINCTFNHDRQHFANDPYENYEMLVNFYKCPSCKKISVSIKGHDKFKGLFVPVFPQASSKQFPEYIPESIRNDYTEAYSILNLSPKASATLARRCLQGMIRNFWGISKNRLIDEINELQSKVPPAQWKVIDAIRSIGNIGAHMEKDVNLIVDITPDESEKLLKLIELLIEKWYVQRHDEEELYNDIHNINTNKHAQKQSS